MNIQNDKQLADTILQIKKYLLGKVQEDMGNVPMEKLKKAKMVITEGGSPKEEPSSELEKIKSLLGGCEEEPEMEEEETEDEDVKKIKAALIARKGTK